MPRSDAPQSDQSAGLIRCQVCGGSAVCVGFDDASLEYQCTASAPPHGWSEERDPACERCEEPLSEHSSVSTPNDDYLVCPGSLEDNTFVGVPPSIHLLTHVD